jgi:hypothetical protein
MKNIIDQIAKWGAVISGIFIFIGIWRAIFYYMPFNIAIHTYIDVGEVLTIWFPDTIFGIIILLILSISFPIIRLTKPRDQGYDYVHISLYIVHILFLIYIFTDMGLNWYGRNSPEKLELIKLYYSIVMVFAMFNSFNLISGFIKALKIWRSRRNNSIEYSRIDAYTNVFFIMFYCFVISISEPLSTTMSSPKASLRMELKGDGKTITTNDTLRYVGKTRNYIFLWNKNTKASTIYPIEQFERISILPN